ncbi:MAG TPA: hypothetical protein VE988_25665 [Gemmataceae bacterium]|nr:hypothetical protein [Gemmataceae bacterium]
METCISLSWVLRRLSGLAIAGGALLFIGKIATVLMALAAFAGIGYLMWLPVQTALFGRPKVRRRESVQPLRQSLECGHQAVAKINDAVETWTPIVRDILLEISCGAIVGILVAMAADTGRAGAVIGALLGVTAGVGVACRRHSP